VNRQKIGKPHQIVARPHLRQHGLDGPHARKVSRRLQQQAGAVGVDGAGGQHDVLALEILDQGVHLNADSGELPRVKLQPDPLILNAQQVDLGDSGELIQLLAEILRDILHFARGEALGGHRDGRNGDVTKVAVDEGTDDTFRQFDLDVADLVTKPLPGRIDVADFVVEVDIDRQRPFGCERPDVLDFGKLPNLAFDRDSDEIFHAFRRHARKQRRHHGGANDDDGVLALWKVRIENHACKQKADHDRDGEARSRKAKSREEIHGAYSCTGRSFTFCPSAK
jgi:hypothetical protein